MATVTIYPGDQITKDPSATKTYVVDWDLLNLSDGARIAASDWYVIGVKPSFTDDGLTLDHANVLSAGEASDAVGHVVAADNRVTQIRIAGGTMNQVYRITNRIETDEVPFQVKEKSFLLLVEQE